jgi:hypothetical protein
MSGFTYGTKQYLANQNTVQSCHQTDWQKDTKMPRTNGGHVPIALLSRNGSGLFFPL